MKSKALITLIGIFCTFHLIAQEEEFIELSLEELMSMEITSVSKKAERLQDIPSSIYVITHEKISRSGAVTVVELLREYVPGFWAASLDFNKNDVYLRNPSRATYVVLLDGTPMNDLIESSMLWDNFEIPLGIIDRIEVIKGSGGVIYGANSATGVISIFTKSPVDGEGLLIDVNAAAPLHLSTDLSYGTKLNEQLAVQLYGRYRYFGGYDQLDVIENETSVVPRTFGEGDTTITSLYTEDDNTYQGLAFGYNLSWKVSERLQLSTTGHFNGIYQDIYGQAIDPSASQALINDVGLIFSSESDVFLTDNDRNRMVGNVSGQFQVSEGNQLFLRASFNREDFRYGLNGGFRSRNSIIDFEVQDNWKIGFNNLSFGANYRLIRYNVYNVDVPSQIDYINAQNTENLSGFFIQDHLTFLEDKLNIYVGAKAENFSLLNNDYYLSPMAKFAYSPTDRFTVWGGYSRSFTTPGYNQTNIELTQLALPTPGGFEQVSPFFAQALVLGSLDLSTEEEAAFLASPEGIAAVEAAIPTIETLLSLSFPDFYNVATISSEQQEPTSFENLEVGFRAQLKDDLYLESNFFYTRVQDDIAVTPAITDTISSPTKLGERVAVTLYGNYGRGTNLGVESTLNYQFLDRFLLELSHTWFFVKDREWQDNDDFNVDDFTTAFLTLPGSSPVVPENVIRARLQYLHESGFDFSVSGLYASAFYNRFDPINMSFQADRQLFNPLFEDGARPFPVGRNSERVIVNFRINKTFNDQLSAFVFANDILKSAFVESTDVLQLTYPRQVGRMIGVGCNVRL
ncbi:MAG: TonB-dependent receptor [Bacteroidota bacterium]